MIVIEVKEFTDPPKMNLDNISRDIKNQFELRIIEILREAGQKIVGRTRSPYLSGASLNKRTGTLSRSIYATDPIKNKDGSIQIGIGVGDDTNPKNKVPAHVYGFAWEGLYPLPGHYKDKTPRPFLYGGGVYGGIVDTQPWMMQQLGEI